ncbi:dynein regulatory complex subunit 6 [Impatiens glandulifera]|uniref:dynein regulatory complex subunit 6 n=1 Tax=Impatiens glandulifera TaxID=253017 RepID=UPI001FB0FD0F|nr:dynein regulatory complex subunit 6 [Impatiens glandulifera]
MTVLRSREVVVSSSIKPHSPRKPTSSMEPITPSSAKSIDSSHDPKPPLNSSGDLNLGLTLTPPRNSIRRSPRLAASSNSINDLSTNRKRKRLPSQSGKDAYIVVDGLQMNVVQTENGITGEIGDDEKEIDVAEGESDAKLGLKELDGDGSSTTHVETRKRFSSREKGKGKMVDLGSGNFGTDVEKQGVDSELGIGIDRNTDPIIQDQPPSHLADHKSVKSPDKEMLVLGIGAGNEIVRKQRGYREAFRVVAKKNAQRFALFSSEEGHVNADDASVVATGKNDKEKEDWPGPFSTAMKIIKDREANANLPRKDINLQKNDIAWIPKKDQNCGGIKGPVPSLQEICTRILAKNASSITSLEGVPDVLRHNLGHLLTDSRAMDAHYLELLTRGSPTEIRVKDCSWLTEEEFIRVFEGCNTSSLNVLQLDQCGRCLTDYNLPSLFGQTSKSLPALSAMSLKGACRLSDAGLGALVSATPELRSINLSQCSLLTCDSIFSLAESVQGLRELYLDDCETIDTTLILPALLNLDHLEVLSLAAMPRVSDDFISDFITVRGPNIKELTLSNCLQLTDSSIKVIGENCPGLLSLDLVNLRKLTDSSIGYLANGCRTIQTLKLCRNSFSDEGIAAYLEASGRSLTELSLNNINQVGKSTAISVAKCCRELVSLDLSWCRKMADEAVGLIVDSCLSLKVLRLFGCTQISDVFVNGHSNRELQIIGLNMMPVLKHINLPNTSEGALRY